MKRIFLIIFTVALTLTAAAQPQARREQQQAAARQSNANNMTTRAQISFPVQSEMSEDVVWRRDIYRELDLNDDANAGLYYPVEPVGTQMNLFTYMFKLVMRGQLKAYKYPTSGNEVFNDSARIKPLQFLQDQDIYFERTDRGIRIDDSDIPSREVMGYYLKESAYYDQASATFHTQVQAVCPILMYSDDFGDGQEKRPLFWVKYEDLAPFLAKQTMMTSNLNNAAVMSVDDYFTKNMYNGKIYKTTNMLGRTLAQVANGNDSIMSAEQKKIEEEIKIFESKMWGDQAKKDSLDSIAKLDKKELKAVKKTAKSTSAKTKTANKTVKKAKSPSGSSSSGSSAARVSVRRERH